MSRRAAVAGALRSFLGAGIDETAANVGAFRRYPVAYRFPDGQERRSFEGGVDLVDVILDPSEYRAGDIVTATSIWKAVGDAHPDLKVFVHIVDEGGTVRAQHDGLDCPARSWAPQDTIVQLHQIRLPGDLGSGRYALRIGVYDRQTLAPYPLVDGSSYLEVGSFEIRGE